MINPSDICSHLNIASPCLPMEDGSVVVNTHCMYPSNGAVLAYIHETISGLVVSDGGGAMRELVTAGVTLGKAPDEKCSQIASAYGLTFYGGIVQAPAVPVGSVALAIILVANASKEMADHLFAAWRPKKEKNFKRLVRDLLTQELHVKPAQEAIFGKTNKRHNFDNVFTLPSGKRAAVDAVVNDANSINSSVLANLDVRASDSPNKVAQAIIYDDSQPWKANDLGLLHIAHVPVVPFSQAGTGLTRLLEAAA